MYGLLGVKVMYCLVHLYCLVHHWYCLISLDEWCLGTWSHWLIIGMFIWETYIIHICLFKPCIFSMKSCICITLHSISLVKVSWGSSLWWVVSCTWKGGLLQRRRSLVTTEKRAWFMPHYMLGGGMVNMIGCMMLAREMFGSWIHYFTCLSCRRDIRSYQKVSLYQLCS